MTTALEDLGLDPQALLAGLQKARASGVLEVQFGDRTVRYKSDQQMAAAIANIEANMARAAGGSSVNVVSIRSTKGW